jgi:hypothetical protein
MKNTKNQFRGISVLLMLPVVHVGQAIRSTKCQDVCQGRAQLTHVIRVLLSIRERFAQMEVLLAPVVLVVRMQVNVII